MIDSPQCSRRLTLTLLCLSLAATLGQDTSTLSSIDDPGNPEDLSLLSGSESDDLAGAGDTHDLPGPTDNKQPAGAPTGVKTIYSKNQCTFDISDAHGATYHYDVSPLSRPNGEGKRFNSQLSTLSSRLLRYTSNRLFLL